MLRTFTKTLIIVLGCFQFVVAVPASAETRVATYMTMISERDIYNSSGTRLTDVAAILAQDRANYHRFGIRDRYDQTDPYFMQRGFRMAIPGLVGDGSCISSTTKQQIMLGSALLVVSLYAQGDELARMCAVIPG